MKTQFNSTTYGITDKYLKEGLQHALNFLENIKQVKLEHISMLPSGHGHYRVKFEFNVDGLEVKFKVTTNNVELINVYEYITSNNISYYRDENFVSKKDVIVSMVNLAENYLEEKIEDVIRKKEFEKEEFMEENPDSYDIDDWNNNSRNYILVSKSEFLKTNPPLNYINNWNNNPRNLEKINITNINLKNA